MTTHQTTTDPAGRWLLDNDPNAYAHAGFTYTTGRDGVLIATGGDAHIAIGIYANDNALADGEPIAYREWHNTHPHTITAAVTYLKKWTTPTQ